MIHTYFCSIFSISQASRVAQLHRNLKTYEGFQLEACRLERDAQRVSLENALLEQERLKTEALSASVELDAAKLELAIKREEAKKMGIEIVFTTESDEAQDQSEMEVT